jgi:hypothetical protein
MSGVPLGMTIMLVRFSLDAEYATPCAWLPAEAVTTPLAICSGVREASLLYAPRILNENTGCWSSRFKYTRLPSSIDSRGANCSCVSRHTSYTRVWALSTPCSSWPSSKGEPGVDEGGHDEDKDTSAPGTSSSGAGRGCKWWMARAAAGRHGSKASWLVRPGACAARGSNMLDVAQAGGG